jgi:peptidoglycan/xylan/chitin deacetylase (PgdA/CDA1 family)
VTPVVEMAAAASALASGAGVCLHHATYNVRSQWLGRTTWHGRTDTQSVALTFDDGPAGDTDAILALLSANRLRAAFFMVGQQVERRPDVARRIVAEGHEIGNHSYSHPIYLYCTPAETYRQLARTQEVITKVTGVTPSWVRPPCGVRTPAYFRATRTLGLRTVQWTVAGFDWQRRTAVDIAEQILRRIAAGAIVLLHDGATADTGDRRATVAALPSLIDGLRRRELSVSPLSDLVTATMAV